MKLYLLVLGAICHLAFIDPSGVESAADENVQEFLALCAINKIARYFEDERTPFIKPTPVQQVDDIIGNVSAIYDLLEGKGEGNKTVFVDGEPRVFKGQFKQPLAAAHCPGALARLQRILTALKGKGGKETESIRKKIELRQSSVVSASGTISADAKAALYGTGGVLSGDSGVTFADNLANAAKKTAGLSLANDIVALCKTGGGTANECLEAPGRSIEATTFTAYGDGTALYQELMRENCVQDVTTEPTTAQIQEALDHFKLLLGKNKGTVTTGSYEKTLASILGKRHSSSTECGNGSNVCVDYKEALSSKGGIKWLKKMIEIQRNVAKIAEERQQIDLLLQRAWSLEENAIHELLILESYESNQLGNTGVSTAIGAKMNSNNQAEKRDSAAVTEVSIVAQRAARNQVLLRHFALVFGYGLI